MDSKWWVLIAAIMIVAVAIVVVYVRFNQGGAQISPVLVVNLGTVSGIVGKSMQLNVSIRNDGGEAKGVVVNLVSDAFDKASSNSIDVPANQTREAQCNVQIKDVDIRAYEVTISYQYNGVGETLSNNTAHFHVTPSIEIVNVHWSQSGVWPFVSEKSTIRPNDNTTLYFEIKSHSSGWTYTGLSATTTMQTSTIGLTATPSFLALDSIGPTGTSKEYSFGLTSNNAPPGTYEITIHVFSNGQYEAASSSKTLTVSQ